MVKSESVRILVIEDEVKLATHLSRALETEGHEARVVHDGKVALVEARDGNYDLLVLDVELPRMDGFEILKQLRSRGVPTRILMLTARSENPDKIAGLTGGADDYLTKPFAMNELLARVNALGRRFAAPPSRILRAGDVTLKRREARGMSRRATHRAVGARMCAFESLNEGTGSRFFANGVERARLGTGARVRYKADRNLYWPAPQKDRRGFNSAVDQNGASSGLCGARRQFSMRHYSLRWKLVTWAALFAFSASVICLWTTWILVRAQELQALDRRLTTDARELFRDIENFQGTNKRRDVTERFVPLALRDRLVEVRGP